MLFILTIIYWKKSNLVMFNDISTLMGYSIPNLVYTHTHTHTHIHTHTHTHIYIYILV